MKNNSKANNSAAAPLAIVRGEVYSYQGAAVRVVGVDADPTATVWICYLGDPDRDAFVPRKELSEIA